MQPSSLTQTEAAILSAIGDDLETTFRELATATRLTVSELRGAVARLANKQLARLTDDQERITLTHQGNIARRMILRHYLAAIVSDVAALEKAAPLGDAELDNAIDQEIAKLRG